MANNIMIQFNLWSQFLNNIIQYCMWFHTSYSKHFLSSHPINQKPCLLVSRIYKIQMIVYMIQGGLTHISNSVEYYYFLTNYILPVHK